MKTLYAKDRRVWRSWLRNHHRKEKEVWLVFFRKATGKSGVTYNESVEEALCYGWIDSIVRRIDDERFAQRFSPRKAKSALSQMNRERVRKLIRGKRMTKAGLAAIAHAFDPATDADDDFTMPPDIVKALRADKEAWKNFQKFPERYKRIRVAYIDGARNRPEEFQKRLRHFVKMTSQNKRIGYVKEMR